MADSENKRRGAGNIPGLYIIYPVPDDVIDDFDREQAAGFYPLGAGEPAVVPPSASAVPSGGGPVVAVPRVARRRRLPIPVVMRDLSADDEELLVMLLL